MCFGVLSSTLHPLCVPASLWRGRSSSLSLPDWTGVVNEGRFLEKHVVCCLQKKILFDVHRFLWWGLRLYSVCLLKSYINVNLTWNCKKSCEYPSISRHLLNVFGNKNEYAIWLIYYILRTNFYGLLNHTRPGSRPFCCVFLSFFYSWLIFLFLLSSFCPMLFICSVSLWIILPD